MSALSVKDLLEDSGAVIHEDIQTWQQNLRVCARLLNTPFQWVCLWGWYSAIAHDISCISYAGETKYDELIQLFKYLERAVCSHSALHFLSSFREIECVNLHGPNVYRIVAIWQPGELTFHWASDRIAAVGAVKVCQYKEPAAKMKHPIHLNLFEASEKCKIAISQNDHSATIAFPLSPVKNST